MGMENLVSRQAIEVRRWYALYVRSHQELAVAKQLALRDVGFYLALYRTVHHWRNRCSKSLELPLFPGYVFVHIGSWERATVLGIQGVVHLVGAPGRPIPLPDGEIETLRSGMAERNPQPHPPLTEGQRVRICRGALAGLEGTLKRCSEGPRVVISLSITSQGASVEVRWNEVEAVDSWPTVEPVEPNTPTIANFQKWLAPADRSSVKPARSYVRDFSPQWKS